MAKLKRLNRSDRAKYNAKFGDVVREISKSSGIISTKSGETFAINDSADAPISNLKIYGRTDQVKTTGANLFDVHSAEYIESKAYAEVSDDGTLKVAPAVNGSYQNAYFSIYKLTVPETIFISFKARMGTDKTVPLIRIRYKNSESGAMTTLYNVTNLTQEWGSYAYKLSITEPRLAEYDTIEIIAYSNNSSTTIPKDEAYVELKDIMISKSDVPYEPYTGLAPSPSPEYPQALKTIAEGGSVGAHIRGKQLFNPKWIHNHSAGGATVTNNGDGSLTVSGSGTLIYTFAKTYVVSDEEARKFLKPGVLYCKFDKITYPYMEIQVKVDGVKLVSFSNRENIAKRGIDISSAFEGNKKITLVVYTGYGTTGSTINPGTIRPLLWQDGDETYDEYREPKTATFPTPNGLLGIPVESGGNYTDVNGQQWICDEIDTDANELIVRIGEVESSSIGDWGTSTLSSSTYYLNNINAKKNTFAMCEEYRSVAYSRETLESDDKIVIVGNSVSIKDSRFVSKEEWGAHIKAHPIKIQYVLAEPIRIPLDDVYNLSTLQTYKPTTVVSNDAGAIVELSYYADKKNYIDQKFAELQALALENK